MSVDAAGISACPTLIHVVLMRPEGVKLVAANPRMLRLIEIASLVSGMDIPVLISGDPGVGKETIARFIHASSSRCNQPFWKIDCASLDSDRETAALFDPELGAFPKAGHGTVFLEEIAEMPPHAQAKLLRALESEDVTGGDALNRPYSPSARVIAATVIPLEAAVAKGQFRPDLYFRLNVISLDIPPLRKRPEDVPVLIQHFMEQASVSHTLPRAIMDALVAYRWPGNVRELQSAIRQFAKIGDPDQILARLKLEDPFTLAPTAEAPSSKAKKVSFKERSAKIADQIEREMVLRVLKATQWNRKQAARCLDISYKSLLRKLHRWGFSNRPGSATDAPLHGASGGSV